MENLHESFGEAYLDFEIDELTRNMIQSNVSFKIGYSLNYDDLTVIQFSVEWCTVMVNATERIIEFRVP